MAHRLLPFRQYDENDVVNLFALQTNINLRAIGPNDDGDNADGVLVSVQAGDKGKNVIDLDNAGDFFASYSSPVGRNQYPTNPLKVAPASSGNFNAIGVTLRSTLAIDENGESLLFNPVKKDELQAVLSGQTVPVLSKGIITVTHNAIKPGDAPAPGQPLAAAANGKFGVMGGKEDDKNQRQIGQVLATGIRENGNATDTWAGTYYVIKLDC
jgi:hypothetical protein